MMMTKEMIKTLNNMALINFERARGMLEGINMVLGTKYGWLAGRVVVFENPEAPDHEKYAHAHDAYTYAN